MKTDSKLVFLKEVDLFRSSKPTKEQLLSNVEINKSLAEIVLVDNITNGPSDLLTFELLF